MDFGSLVKIEHVNIVDDNLNSLPLEEKRKRTYLIFCKYAKYLRINIYNCQKDINFYLPLKHRYVLPFR